MMAITCNRRNSAIRVRFAVIDIFLAIMAAILITGILIKREQTFIDLSMQDVSASMMFPKKTLQTAFGFNVGLMKSHLL